MKSAYSSKSFTIIETIVTMVLLAVMIVASLNIFPLLMTFVTKEEQRLVADNVAYSQLEDLRRIAHSVSGGFTEVGLVSGAHPNPNAFSAYNKVVPPTGYTLTYNVQYGATGNPWPLDTVNTNMDYKTVVVTCTTPSGYHATLTGEVSQ